MDYGSCPILVSITYIAGPRHDEELPLSLKPRLAHSLAALSYANAGPDEKPDPFISLSRIPVFCRHDA